MTAPLSDAELAECRAAATSVELTLLNEINRLRAALAERDRDEQQLLAVEDAADRRIEELRLALAERDRLGGELAAALHLLTQNDGFALDALDYCKARAALARARAAGWLK